jgi:cytochrome c biogenesis protein CcdA
MDIMAFMEIMGTSGIPVIAAFFIGLMTAISPCPMATNITAIAAISRRTEENRRTFLVGITYTTGRALTYAGIASLVVWIGLSTQFLSPFLQGYGELLLGPFLIILGVLMSGIVRFPVIKGSERFSRFKENLSRKGLLGSFLLGVIFALAFCPFSAVLFFGMLIPLALAAGDGIIIPSVFAVGTGLPVIIFSLALSYSISKVAVMMNKMQVIDKWVRMAVSIVFIIVGIYCLIVIYA